MEIVAASALRLTSTCRRLQTMASTAISTATVRMKAAVSAVVMVGTTRTARKGDKKE